MTEYCEVCQEETYFVYFGVDVGYDDDWHEVIEDTYTCENCSNEIVQQHDPNRRT